MGYVTSEKQAPSALDLLGSIAKAIDVERRQANSKPGVSKALKDMLSKVVGDFNKLVSNKKHRIDTGRNHSCTICYLPAWELVLCLLKCLSLALRLFNSIALNPCSALRLRAPEALGSILHKHYDAFPHEISGNASLCHLLAGNFRVKFLQDYRWNCYSLTTGCLQFLLVPNLPKFAGKQLFREILSTTGESCLLWATRMVQDLL